MFDVTGVRPCYDEDVGGDWLVIGVCVVLV